ncbi:MAG: RNA polymerase sigma factor RpoH [Kiloniellales bacterium]
MNNLAWSKSGDLTGYFQDIRKFPLLSAEREQGLARRWRDSGDEAALRELIGSHLRLVVKIARGNSGYGLPLDDLIAEGNLGLMQAAMRFDPERGFRFATYASWWIRAMIHEHVLHSWSLVKMGTTAAQKKLFFNLRRLKNRLEMLESGDLDDESVATIARTLEVPEADVVEMNRRLSGSDVSLNAPTAAEDANELQDFLISEDETAEGIVAEADELAKRRALLRQGLAQLTARERHIVSERQLSDEPLTLQTLSEHYGISRERVRQIEAKALDKLRQSVLAAAPADSRPANANDQLADAA